jgi:replicative DNA helicase
MKLEPILQLEQEIICHMLESDSENYLELAQKCGLTAGSFINDRAKAIFAWIEERQKEQKPASFLALITHVPDAVDFLSRERFENRKAAVNMPHFIRDLADYTYLRMTEPGLESLLAKIRHEATPSLAEFVKTQICDWADKIHKAKTTPSGRARLFDVTGEFIEELEQAVVDYRSGKSRGIPTGFKEIDELTGGLMPESLTLVGARTSVGKTTFAINIAIAALLAGKKVLFVATEMSKKQIAEKFYSNRALVNGTRMRKGNLSNQEESRIAGAVRLNQELPLFFDDRCGKTIDEFVRGVRSAKRDEEIDLVILDYLQQVRVPQLERQPMAYQIGYISSEIKDLSRQLEIPIVGLVQLNRDYEKEKAGTPPNLSHIKDSGSIEQDCDVALFLYRELIEKPTIRGQQEEDEFQYKVAIAKNRFGKPCSIDIKADLALNRFSDA